MLVEAFKHDVPTRLTTGATVAYVACSCHDKFIRKSKQAVDLSKRSLFFKVIFSSVLSSAIASTNFYDLPCRQINSSEHPLLCHWTTLSVARFSFCNQCFVNGNNMAGSTNRHPVSHEMS